MNLVDRYVRAVGAQLPVERRDDVETELASLVQDKIDAEQERLGRELTLPELDELIKACGHPWKVAAEYCDQRSLIGPELYPLFRNTVWIVLGVILLFKATGLAAFLGGIEDLGTWQAKNWYQLLGRTIHSMVYSFGVITLVFAAFERYGEDGRWIYQNWSPRKLPNVEGHNEVKRGETLAEAVFLLVFILLFNNVVEVENLMPLFHGRYSASMAEALSFWVMPINLIALAFVVLSVYVLLRQAWSRWARIINIVLTVAAIGIVMVVMEQQSIVVLTPETVMDTQTTERFANSVNTGLRVSLGIVCLFWAWDVYSHGRRLMAAKRATEV